MPESQNVASPPSSHPAGVPDRPQLDPATREIEKARTAYIAAIQAARRRGVPVAALLAEGDAVREAVHGSAHLITPEDTSEAGQ